PRKAEPRGYDGYAALIVELLRGDSHPIAQAVPGSVGEGYSGHMDPSAWRLAAHGKPRSATCSEHRTRLMRQRLALRGFDAKPARANGGEQAVELAGLIDHRSSVMPSWATR